MNGRRESGKPAMATWDDDTLFHVGIWFSSKLDSLGLKSWTVTSKGASSNSNCALIFGQIILRCEAPLSPAVDWLVSLLVCNDGFGIKYSQRFDMLLNNATKPHICNSYQILIIYAQSYGFKSLFLFMVNHFCASIFGLKYLSNTNNC